MIESISINPMQRIPLIPSSLVLFEMMLKEKCGNVYIYQRPLPKNHDQYVHQYIKYTFIDESDKSDSK